MFSNLCRRLTYFNNLYCFNVHECLTHVIGNVIGHHARDPYFVPSPEAISLGSVMAAQALLLLSIKYNVPLEQIQVFLCGKYSKCKTNGETNKAKMTNKANCKRELEKHVEQFLLKLCKQADYFNKLALFWHNLLLRRLGRGGG